MARFANIITLALALLGVFSLCQAAGVDDLNVNLLNDPAFVQKGVKCVLERGPCDVIGTTAKAALREALGNNCRRCNAQQRANMQRLVEAMSTRYPREWAEIVRKYSNPGRRNF